MDLLSQHGTPPAIRYPFQAQEDGNIGSAEVICVGTAQHLLNTTSHRGDADARSVTLTLTEFESGATECADAERMRCPIVRPADVI